MAKILGHKEIKKKQYYDTCEKCGAIVVFDESEIKDEYQYNEYCFSHGTCPECGEKVYFNKYHSRYKGE